MLTLRAGVQVSPAYLGSDDYEVGPDLAARLDYIRFPGGFEFGSGRTVGFRTGWGLRGSARYLGERDADEHDEIEGLDDVDWSLRGSASASATSSATGAPSPTCATASSATTPGWARSAPTASPIRSTA